MKLPIEDSCIFWQLFCWSNSVELPSDFHGVCILFHFSTSRSHYQAKFGSHFQGRQPWILRVPDKDSAQGLAQSYGMHFLNILELCIYISVSNNLIFISHQITFFKLLFLLLLM